MGSFRIPRHYVPSVLATVFCIVIAAGPTEGYNSAGHFGTVLVIVQADFTKNWAGLRANERTLVSYCAQLPDASRELSATSTYTTATLKWNVLNWIRWGIFDSVPNDDYKRLIAVQQLLHSLTGGDSSAMRAVALGTMAHLTEELTNGQDVGSATRSTQLCALGFAFHMYGDTFSHRILPWDNDSQTGRLYPTGRGHAFDLHYPDDLHCNRVAKDWTGDTNCILDPAQNRYWVWTTYLALTSTWVKLADPTAAPIDLEGASVNQCAGADISLVATLCKDVQLIVAGKKTRGADYADQLAFDVIGKDLGLFLSTNGDKRSSWRMPTLDSEMGSCDNKLLSALNLIDPSMAANWPDDTTGRCKQVWAAYTKLAAGYLKLCEQRRDQVQSPSLMNPKFGMVACRARRPVADGAQWQSLASTDNPHDDSLFQYAALVLSR